jgi:hypothetical protein
LAPRAGDPLAEDRAPQHPGLPLGRKNTIIYFNSGSMRASRVRGSMAATWDAKDWFVLLRGKQYGPYTYAGLVRAAASGIVDPKAGVWCVGWDEWRIARDVPGLGVGMLPAVSPLLL